ncbi:MAG: hypothetical protein A3C90_03705 [Candidatus Magasanikbacteria bacterium RIFCSPHIGHO2_02_FULL_51_14]|uniref:Uncharacterized protein n=1 Tax=Candidatus Magasanikbacteria bacterium RIFCSPHIGHO2_02_FULL_51_14 TaxID=1798683 RepID=A0A1F6MDR3_9BACT|nr:MAG: hypothetical protein A3C90_03705 [Candidatus Magasanikbacteria bacterium RIFCSPHIGHO2_02_FULL_51_14]
MMILFLHWVQKCGRASVLGARGEEAPKGDWSGDCLGRATLGERDDGKVDRCYPICHRTPTLVGACHRFTLDTGHGQLVLLAIALREPVRPWPRTFKKGAPPRSGRRSQTIPHIFSNAPSASGKVGAFFVSTLFPKIPTSLSPGRIQRKDHAVGFFQNPAKQWSKNAPTTVLGIV